VRDLTCIGKFAGLGAGRGTVISGWGFTAGVRRIGWSATNKKQGPWVPVPREFEFSLILSAGFSTHQLGLQIEKIGRAQVPQLERHPWLQTQVSTPSPLACTTMSRPSGQRLPARGTS
jgi:hypothetical protein